MKLFLFALAALLVAGDDFLSINDFSENTPMVVKYSVEDISSLSDEQLDERFERVGFYEVYVEELPKEMDWVRLPSRGSYSLTETDSEVRPYLVLAAGGLLEGTEDHVKRSILEETFSHFPEDQDLSYVNYSDVMSAIHRRSQEVNLRKRGPLFPQCLFQHTQRNGFVMVGLKKCNFLDRGKPGKPWDLLTDGSDTQLDLSDCPTSTRDCSTHILTQCCGLWHTNQEECETHFYFEADLSSTETPKAGKYYGCIWDDGIQTRPNHQDRVRCRSRDAEFAIMGYWIKNNHYCVNQHVDGPDASCKLHNADGLETTFTINLAPPMDSQMVVDGMSGNFDFPPIPAGIIPDCQGIIEVIPRIRLRARDNSDLSDVVVTLIYPDTTTATLMDTACTPLTEFDAYIFDTGAAYTGGGTTVVVDDMGSTVTISAASATIADCSAYQHDGGAIDSFFRIPTSGPSLIDGSFTAPDAGVLAVNTVDLIEEGTGVFTLRIVDGSTDDTNDDFSTDDTDLLDNRIVLLDWDLTFNCVGIDEPPCLE